jgi:hypothetical protein
VVCGCGDVAGLADAAGFAAPDGAGEGFTFFIDGVSVGIGSGIGEL